MAASFPGFPLALNVRQILAIDLGTDLLPALALGTEKPEADVMQRPPRPRGTHLIDNKLLSRAFLWLGMIEAVMCFAIFIAIYISSGNVAALNIPHLARLTAQIPIPRFLEISNIHPVAVSVFFVGVIMAQIGNVFACRTSKLSNRSLGWLSNKYILIGIILELLGILVLTKVPEIASLFQHQDIPLKYWGGLALFPFILYGLERIRKQVVLVMEARTHSPGQ